jgi:hypothetical protein
MIQRLERNAAAACLAMAVLAGALTRGWMAPAAVLGGGVLIAISFVSIRGGLEDVAVRRRARRGALKFAGRHALLGFLAYVMIARLRLPPLGLIAGASSIVAAVAIEAAGLLMKNARQKRAS